MAFLGRLFASAPAAAVVWEWEDGSRGSGQWKPFDAASSAKVEAAHASGATLTLKFGSTSYSIDPGSLTQTNTRTRWVRTIRRNGGGGGGAAAAAAASSAPAALPVSAPPAMWEWEDGSRGSGRWKPFDASSTRQLESVHASSGFSATLTFGSTAYALDTRNMSQTNTRTGYVRNIRRLAHGARKKAKASAGGASRKAQWFSVGDVVKVKASVSAPSHGWGSVNHSHRGPITSISPPDCTVDFSAAGGQADWSGRLDEMELAGAAPPPPVDEALALGFPPLSDDVSYSAAAPDPDWASLTQWTALAPGEYDPAALSVVTGDALGAGRDDVVRLPCHTAHTPCVFIRANIERCLALTGMCMCKRRWRIRGQQPDGTMRVTRSGSSCAGHGGAGTIHISYRLPSGTQGAQHPHPGVAYSGAQRAAYLPDTAEGRAALRMLKRAFQHGLLFRVGKSITSGDDNTTVWGSVHQKTSESGGATQHGWPDPSYFARLQSECASVGLLTEQFLKDEAERAAKLAASAAPASAAAASGAAASGAPASPSAASAAAPTKAQGVALAKLEREYAALGGEIKKAKSDRSKLMVLMKRKKVLRKKIKAAKA